MTTSTIKSIKKSARLEKPVIKKLQAQSTVQGTQVGAAVKIKGKPVVAKTSKTSNGVGAQVANLTHAFKPAPKNEAGKKLGVKETDALSIAAAKKRTFKSEAIAKPAHQAKANAQRKAKAKAEREALKAQRVLERAAKKAEREKERAAKKAQRMQERAAKKASKVRDPQSEFNLKGSSLVFDTAIVVSQQVKVLSAVKKVLDKKEWNFEAEFVKDDAGTMRLTLVSKMDQGLSLIHI